MVNIYFATNRELSGIESTGILNNNFTFTNKSKDYSDINLRFGKADVDLKTNIINLDIFPDIMPKYSENKITNYTELSSTKIFEEIYESMNNDKKDTIIYFHGFNTSFQDSLITGAKIKEALSNINSKNKSNYDPNVFVFTWPSNAKLLDYLQDRHDAKTSGYSFARGLAKLKNFINTKNANCGQKINLITHSMGAYALRNTILSLKEIPETFTGRIFEEILMFAADEDRDSFEDDNKLASLPEYAQRITIYFNNKDLALGIGSRFAKFNGERLGNDGTKSNHIDRKIVLVDVTNVVDKTSEELIRHNYIFENKIINDAYQVLIGTQTSLIKKTRDYSEHDKKFILK